MSSVLCRDKYDAQKDVTTLDNLAGLQVKADNFVKSKAVIGLTSETFQTYLNGIDVALVMFYDTDDPQCIKSRTQLKKAAESLKMSGRAYAAVDCVADASCCAMENVQSVPHFRIYCRGNVADYLKTEPEKFLNAQMKDWVEKFPNHTR